MVMVPMLGWLCGECWGSEPGHQGEKPLTRLDVPQVFPWLEADALALGDVQAGPSLDVPAHAPLARMRLDEHAEPTDLDAVPIQQGLLHAVGEEIHHLEGSGFGDGQGLHQGAGDVDLDHDGLGLGWW